MAKKDEIGGGVDGKMKNIQDSVTRTENYVIGIAFVSALSVLTLLFSFYATWRDSNQFKTETYQVLVDKVNQTNQKIDELTKQKEDLKFENIQNQLDLLKEKNPYLK